MTGGGVLPIRRALIAVADKAGLVPFGLGLAERGVVIVSTGKTARALADAGVPVTPVSEVTGFPEMLDGRVKTLHPRVHAGILADKENPGHTEQLRGQGIEPFDLVAVNLYPFEQAVEQEAHFDEVIEQIDIGGPAMVRAAAKNFRSVAVVVSPESYGPILDELGRMGGVSDRMRLRLARLAFAHTAAYEAAIASWFSEQRDGADPDALPTEVRPVYRRAAPLRYGENPHQRGALFALGGTSGPLGGAEILQGKEMSYNNWLDAEAARALAALFDRPAAVIVKHHNPCGVAMAATLAEAYEKALAGDRVSAFGGIVAFNREVDGEAATSMGGIFTEVVIAPSYAEAALETFRTRQNLRVVVAPMAEAGGLEIRQIDGGALVQDGDVIVETAGEMKVVTATEPTPSQWEDLLFAWKVAAGAKSNAIVLAVGLATVGLGAGQMNRLTSVDIAARHAGPRASGSCLASDAFFPFRDGVDRAAEAGVAAIIQPGGSIRDEEVIAAAEEHGIPMVFTGRRHFRH